MRPDVAALMLTTFVGIAIALVITFVAIASVIGAAKAV
jgi:hypothetical protein